MKFNTVKGSFTGIGSFTTGVTPEPEYYGVTMVFAQSAAPYGWVKQTDYDNYALRVVSGTGGTSASGNQPFSTVFSTSKTIFAPESGTWPVSSQSTTLSISQMKAHTHPANDYGAFGGSFGGSGPGSATTVKASPSTPFPAAVSGSAGTGGGHAHASGTVTAISYTSSFNLTIKYKDAILAKYH